MCTQQNYDNHCNALLCKSRWIFTYVLNRTVCYEYMTIRGGIKKFLKSPRSKGARILIMWSIGHLYIFTVPIHVFRGDHKFPSILREVLAIFMFILRSLKNVPLKNKFVKLPRMNIILFKFAWQYLLVHTRIYQVVLNITSQPCTNPLNPKSQ